MPNLETNYLGLKLKNPIVVSSSGLTASVPKIVEMEKNGAGAVVLKSLFEEQILHDAGRLEVTSDYPEASDYIRSYTKSNSVGEYLTLIKEAKLNVSIPIIASINCVSSSDWVDFAKKMEAAGADALEVNVFFLPTDNNKPASFYENTYLELAEKLRGAVKLPIAFKLGNHFTNVLWIIRELYFRKINGVVLFNRFYEPDIDINKMKMVSSEVFSHASDIRTSLRWVALSSNKVPNMSIAASTGIQTGEAVIKMLLAGASATQVCSSIYKGGPAVIAKMVDALESWMATNHYKTIEDFRGKLSYSKIPDPAAYERSQFMRYFSSME